MSWSHQSKWGSIRVGGVGSERVGPAPVRIDLTETKKIFKVLSALVTPE